MRELSAHYSGKLGTNLETSNLACHLTKPSENRSVLFLDYFVPVLFKNSVRYNPKRQVVFSKAKLPQGLKSVNDRGR